MSIPQSWWTWITRANQLVRMTVAEAELQWAEWYPDSTFTTVPADAPDDYFVCRAITNIDSFNPCTTDPDDHPLTVLAQSRPCSIPHGGGTGPEVTADTECNCTRLYFANTDAPTGTTSLTPHAGWANPSFQAHHRDLSLTPTGTAGGGVDGWDGVNVPVSNMRQQGHVLALSGAPGILAAVQAGGTVHGQFLTSARNGIGINEAAQNDIANMSMQVWTPGSPGTYTELLAPHTAASGNRFPPQSTMVNRTFGPWTFDAMPGAASTDYLFVEIGSRHLGPISGGTGTEIAVKDSAASDLPEDETTTDGLNSWIDICA